MRSITYLLLFLDNSKYIASAVKMVDIEPMLTYDYSQIGIKTIYHMLTILYITYIYPIIVILNYNIKTEKEIIKQVINLFINIVKPTLYKVSKDDLNLSKNIMYMPNHLSVSDFYLLIFQ